MQDKEEVISSRKGFIAALDQSGGSSRKTLSVYGIDENSYKDDSLMFDLIHDMRKRIITSKSFTKEHIIGVILFEDTVNRHIDGINVVKYLWDKKRIVSFIKIDKGLEDEKNGVRLMKDIPNLLDTLDNATKLGIFGTKMRSVINGLNEEGIEDIVKQQFFLAKIIYSKGLVPIIEPEVSIDCLEKEEIEKILKEKIEKELNNIPNDMKVVLKLTLPTKANFYKSLVENKNVLKVVALSGGYKRDEATKRLLENNKVVASFSRALLEDLRVYQDDDTFDKILKRTILQIYNASIS